VDGEAVEGRIPAEMAVEMWGKKVEREVEEGGLGYPSLLWFTKKYGAIMGLLKIKNKKEL
jgi:hypothetical protein